MQNQIRLESKEKLNENSNEKQHIIHLMVTIEGEIDTEVFKESYYHLMKSVNANQNIGTAIDFSAFVENKSSDMRMITENYHKRLQNKLLEILEDHSNGLNLVMYLSIISHPNNTTDLIFSYPDIYSEYEIYNVIYDVMKIYSSTICKNSLSDISFNKYARYSNSSHGVNEKVEYYFKTLQKDYEITYYDKEKPSSRQFREEFFKIKNDVSTSINGFITKNNVSLKSFFTAVCSILLQRYYYTEDIIIGVSLPNNMLDSKSAFNNGEVGNHLCSFPIRVSTTPNLTYKNLLNIINKDYVRAEHTFCQDSELNNSYIDNKEIFKYLIEFEDALAIKDLKSRLGDIKLDFKLKDLTYTTSVYNENMRFIVNTNDGLEIGIKQRCHINEEHWNGRVYNHLLNIIKQVIEKPDIEISEISLISQEEKDCIINNFNDTATNYPKNESVISMFREQVDSKAEKKAIVFGDNQISYIELDKRSNRIARYLKYGLGVVEGDLVGVMLDKSIEYICCIVGILKAGAAYVPIDTSYPENRVKLMVEDVGLTTIISSKNYIRLLNRLQWECYTLKYYICIDSNDVYAEDEEVHNQLMDQNLWEYVSQSATDAVVAGGWMSSYTGEYFSLKEIDEFIENTYQKLKPYLTSDKKVLEIGCASGLTMFKIAPEVGLYYGTDMSNAVLEQDMKIIKEKGFNNIKLKQCVANEIATIEERGFDLIILNSVVQCFHGHNYLRNVIKEAISLLNDQGVIFIGDIMDQKLKTEFLTSLAEFKYKNKGSNKTKTDFNNELFLSREYLDDLTIDFDEIKSVYTSKKIHTIKNELTMFRYDAILEIDKTHFNDSSNKNKYQLDFSNVMKYSTDRIECNIPSLTPAYVMYTSGSTGRPKGVVINHRNILRLVMGTNFIELKDDDNILSTGAIGFDASTFEIWGALLNGMTIYMTENEVLLNAQKLAHELSKNKITILWLTSPLFNQLVAQNPSIFSGLKYLIVGGDVLEPRNINLVRKYCRNLKIINGYGPTENTTFSTTCLIDKDYNESIPIGKPIANSTCYIVDKYGNLLPLTAIGELWVGGDGVSRGYFNNPALTEEKFLSKCFINEEKENRVYKTGDIGRWLPDGSIEFLGRMDQQVKIRGFRIETGEIEASIRNNPYVQNAVVSVQKDDTEASKYLCAYIVLKEDYKEHISMNDIKEYISKDLPKHMTPSYYVKLDRIPLTQNGKIDRKGLPDPKREYEKKIKKYVAPKSSLEKKIIDIYKQIFSIEKIGITDDFFDDLGGDSLKVMQLTALLENSEIEITLNAAFQYRTANSLALYLSSTEKNRTLVKNISEAERLLKEHLKCDCSLVKYLLSGYKGYQNKEYIVLYLKDTDTVNFNELYSYIEDNFFPNIYPNYLLPLSSIKSEGHFEQSISENGFSKTVNLLGANIFIQYHTLKKNLKSEWKKFNKAVTEGEIIKEYPCSPIQESHLKFPIRVVVGAIRFDRYIDIDRFREAVKNMISTQEIMRSTLIKNDDNSTQIREYSDTSEDYLSVIDLSKYRILTQEQILKKFAVGYFLKEFPKYGSVNFRLALVKQNESSYVLLYSADHTVIDFFSEDAIRRTILEYYDNDTSDLSEGIHYEDYVKQIRRGPKNIDANKLSEIFNLSDYKLAFDNIYDIGKKMKRKKTHFSRLKVRLPKNLTNEQRWDLMFLVYINFCQKLFDVSEIPLGIMYHGRKYEKTKFLNKVGEFIDVIPIYIDFKTTDSISRRVLMREKIKAASDYNISFLNLLSDSTGDDKWSLVNSLVTNNYFKIPSILLYNYVDKTVEAEEDILRKIFLVMLQKYARFISAKKVGVGMMFEVTSLKDHIELNLLDMFGFDKQYYIDTLKNEIDKIIEGAEIEVI